MSALAVHAMSGATQNRPYLPSHEELDAVRESFAAIAPAMSLVTELFFRRLYETEPDLKHLFPGSDCEHRQALSTFFSLAITSLGRLEEIFPALRMLGAKGRDLQIGPYYYGVFGETLLWTLEQCLDERFTPEVKDGWASVYTAMAEVMVEGS